MAGGYRLRIRIEMVPDEPQPDAPVLAEEITQDIDRECARSIDQMEEVLLNNNYELMRQFMAAQLTAQSKKRPPSAPPPGN